MKCKKVRGSHVVLLGLTATPQLNGMRAEVIERLARDHAQSLYANHSQMAAKLAEANAAGEVGRKEEMKRIFGIEV